VSHRIAIHSGDGIGRDVVAEVVPILTGARRASSSSRCRGAPTITSRPASPFHPAATTPLRAFDAIFIGALGDPRVPDNRHARDILLGRASRSICT